MKNLLYVSLLLLNTAFFAQDFKEMNNWSAGLSIGGHDGFKPTTLFTKAYQIHHIKINGRYMFNNRFGLMADGAYDFIDATNGGSLNVNYVRLSVQGVASLSDLMRFDSWTSKIGLLLHSGAGFSTMWCPSKKLTNPKDKFIPNADDMLNFTLGITPQYKINERFSVNTDISLVAHARQHKKFDYTKNTTPGISGYFFNWSLGATYYFGKKEKHADWIPTVYDVSPVDLSKYDQLIKELQEKVKDDDGDGVPNYVDAEPETIKDAFVDSKGVALKDNDKDKDGISDEYDLCPDVMGLFSTNGCPDSDGDGISDENDGCPKIKGLATNNGCPIVPKEVLTVLDKALKNVQFETNKDQLLKSSFAALNEVVNVLISHPEYKLLITGHTDNVGDDAINMTLSDKRARACANYLISKGIESSRFEVHGYGETKPVATNDTKGGRALNRRVEFTVVF